jgi:hypothetical protein
MSGFTEKDTIDRFAGKALAGFIQKPFDRKTAAGQAARRAGNRRSRILFDQLFPLTEVHTPGSAATARPVAHR